MKKIVLADKEQERRILAVANKHGGYEIEYNENGAFINSPEICDPFRYICIRSSNIEDAQEIIASYITDYSAYKEYSYQYDECIKRVNRIKKPATANDIQYFKSGILHCPRNNLIDFYCKEVAPRFFSCYPEGYIIIANTGSSRFSVGDFISL